MKLLALDFDGVIFDGAPECFWVSIRTLERVRPGTLDATRLAGWEALPGERVRAAICSDPLFPGFLDIMPLGNRAEDFGVALLALEAGHTIRTQRDYDLWFEAQDPSFAEDFQRHFYHERADLRSASESRWGELMSPCRELIEVLRRRKGECQVVIATAKDGVSVSKLIAHFGIDDVFAPGCIYDKQAGRSKRNHITSIQADYGVDFSDITFIDDKFSHLAVVAALGVRCLLACWGFNGPREKEQALANAIGTCELADLEASVFG